VEGTKILLLKVRRIGGHCAFGCCRDGRGGHGAVL
jgi:hypothetical protein